MAEDLVPAATARRFLLRGQGLLADPARRATAAAVERQIGALGYVQIDTINAVERAHHHILMSRFDGYRPKSLAHLLEKRRALFEHWTHDAAVIPVAWLPHWLHRFERHAREMRSHPGWVRRMGGDLEARLDEVRTRIAREGPLRSADFEHPPRGGSGSFWNWKPQKAALEWLWRSGELSVARRHGFQKVYDLSERVFPGFPSLRASSPAEHVDWACRSVFERLEIATPGDVARYFDAIPIATVRAWCREAEARGELVPVRVAAVDDAAPRPAFARADWRRRARGLPDPPARARALNPFDPILRDRPRAARLFGFDYRLEVFVPAAKRRYGYYVLPVLEGERFVARLDARHDRDAAVLRVLGFWWEPGVRPGARRRRAVTAAIERLASQLGAGGVAFERRARAAF